MMHVMKLAGYEFAKRVTAESAHVLLLGFNIEILSLLRVLLRLFRGFLGIEYGVWSIWQHLLAPNLIEPQIRIWVVYLKLLNVEGLKLI